MLGTHRAAARSRRRWLITAMVVGLVAALVGPAGATSHITYGVGEYPLYAGQDILVGKVVVTNDADKVFVEFDLDDPWCMTESHVDVVTTPDDFPTTKSGNPIPGKFELAKYHDCTTGTTHEFERGEGTYYIAAHAEVWDTSSVDEVTFSSADTSDMTGFGRFDAYDTAKTSTTPSLIRTLLESEQNVGWNDTIGSPWVTIDEAAYPDIDQWFRVDHAIVVDGLPSGDGYVRVNSDNADEVLGYTSVTGKPGAITGVPIRPAHDQISEYRFPVSEGDNTVQFVVRNYFPTIIGGPNPMALTYSGSVQYYDTEESAWAGETQGETQFDGANWATYFQYTTTAVPVCVVADGFVPIPTFTPATDLRMFFPGFMTDLSVNWSVMFPDSSTYGTGDGQYRTDAQGIANIILSAANNGITFPTGADCFVTWIPPYPPPG